MKLNLKFFSTYRDVVGLREMTLELQKGASLQTLLEILVKHYPGLTAYAETVIMAVNRDFASMDTKLMEGDEIALMPPVGGG